jgi:hypothetical protein
VQLRRHVPSMAIMCAAYPCSNMTRCDFRSSIEIASLGLAARACVTPLNKVNYITQRTANRSVEIRQTTESPQLRSVFLSDAVPPNLTFVKPNVFAILARAHKREIQRRATTPREEIVILRREAVPSDLDCRFLDGGRNCELKRHARRNHASPTANVRVEASNHKAICYIRIQMGARSQKPFANP